jgi:hypothetical protein
VALIPTNDPEYMRNYQRWKRNPDKYPDPRKRNVKKPLQSVKNNVKNIMLERSLERLHPPGDFDVSARGTVIDIRPLIPPEVSETSVSTPPDRAWLVKEASSDTDSTLTIDFNKIANSSEFKRFMYYIYTGKTHRGTKDQLDWDIKKKRQEVQEIKALPAELLAELKEKLKGRKID